MRRITLILGVLALAVLAAVACSGSAGQPAATLAAPTESDAAQTEPAPAVESPSAAPSETATEPPPTAEPTATTQPTATDEPTPEPTPTATQEPTPEPTATAPPTEAPAPERAAVTIDDFLFSPSSITVRAGSTVTWTHVGNARHTVTADDGSFDSGTLSGGGTFDFTFSAAGTYTYYCRLHGAPGQEGMSAVITVTQ